MFQRFITFHCVDDISADELAAFIIRQASIALDIAERKLHGSRYKVPRYVADSLVSGRRFRKAIK